MRFSRMQLVHYNLQLLVLNLNIVPASEVLRFYSYRNNNFKPVSYLTYFIACKNCVKRCMAKFKEGQ